MWSSSNNSVATVSSSGSVTGISEGTATITATKAISGHYETATFSITVTPLYNGTYFIKNKESQKYIQIEDINASTYEAVGDVIEKLI